MNSQPFCTKVADRSRSCSERAITFTFVKIIRRLATPPPDLQERRVEINLQLNFLRQEIRGLPSLKQQNRAQMTGHDLDGQQLQMRTIRGVRLKNAPRFEVERPHVDEDDFHQP